MKVFFCVFGVAVIIWRMMWGAARVSYASNDFA